MAVFSKLWTPRLHPWGKDSALWKSEPICAAFVTAAQSKSHHSVEQMFQTLLLQLRSAHWLELISEWISYCLGGELVNPNNLKLQEIQGRVFLEVLWLRFNHNEKDIDAEKMALDSLLAAQMKSFRAYTTPPPEVSFFHDVQAGDEESYLTDLGEGDADPTFEDNIVPKPRPTGNQSKKTSKAFVLPVKRDAILKQARWQELYRDKTAVVNSLCQMRKITRSQRLLRAWSSSFVESGLARIMQGVTRPGNLLETSHPDVEASFRYHDWRHCYGAILDAFITPEMVAAVNEEVLNPDKTPSTPNRRFEPMELLSFISSHPEMHPWGSNLMAVYMFASADCFEANWYEWMAPCLENLKFPLDSWEPRVMYRTLMAHPVMIDMGFPALEHFHHKLRAIIRLTHEHRHWLKEIKHSIFRPREFEATPGVSTLSPRPPTSPNRKRKDKRPEKTHSGPSVKKQVLGKPTRMIPPLADDIRGSGVCNLCKHLGEDEKCRRTVWVTERDVEYLRGCVLTCAPPGDELPPRPGSGKCPKILRPADLQFELRVITYREDVYNRCGKDITKFVLRETKECVGGARFRALSTEVFSQLQNSHRLISVCALKRRASMEAYAYGTMSGRGSRQATGGWTGDTYAPYAVHQGNTIEDFEALFRQGMDADTLVTAGCSIYPPLRAKIAKSTNKSGLSRFGTLGGTSFYCTNYMSTIHDDEDDGEDAEHDAVMSAPTVQVDC
ncbi:hypothetical protein DFH06DRAFT_1326695 [Mycena polygramma]|nr:hypothetical protein DFH06DRAFT_1326695 [Mycena polygramma]